MAGYGMRRCLIGLALCAAVMAAGAARAAPQQASNIECRPPTPCVMKDVQRVLQVLPRPFSNIYADQSTDSAVVQRNVRAFYPLLALDRVDVDLDDPKAPKGWYKVGPNRDTPRGWMQARDVIEWKQAMVVSYSNPGLPPRKRKPVLMFDSKDKAYEALGSTADAQQLYDQLARREVPPGVVSREPDRFLDIRKRFYMLPILDHSEIEVDSVTREVAHVLQVTAAVPNVRARAEELCTTDRRDFAECMAKSAGRSGDSLTVDVVYVIDMTDSMQPYIQAVYGSMLESARKFSEVAGSVDRIKFGLVGFRDSVEKWPENEFVVKNFTEQLVSNTEFERLLKGAQAKAGGDIPEAVFAGMETALGVAGTDPRTPNIRWDEKAIKLLVLVGDASSHERPDPLATSNYSATELRRFADHKNISIAAIYIKNPNQREDWDKGTDQFTVLAQNPGGLAFRKAEPSADDIQKAVFEATSFIVESVREAVRAGAGAESAKSAADSANCADNPIICAYEDGLIVYLGAGAEPPRDITVWMSDRDLTNPALRALDVNVLVSRRDLEELTTGLNNIVTSYQNMDVVASSWFQALSSMSGLASVGQLKLSTALKDSPLIPKWVAGLPYKSRILEMTFERFDSINGSDRDQMVKDIEGKLRNYRQFLADDKWIALQEGDPPEARVYALPLTALP
jgi:serine/threonine-protein kinase PpkA